MAAARLNLGVAGIVISATQNTPHFWESFYDTDDAELVFLLGSLLGLDPKKPPHMGGDPDEYFRGTELEGTNFGRIYEHWTHPAAAR